MKIAIKKENLKDNLHNSLKRCGYTFQHETSEAQSYTRILSRLPYPRFHVYVEDKGQEYVVSLHLDQKKPVYRGSAWHQGEYDSPLVAEELNRIKNAL